MNETKSYNNKKYSEELDIYALRGCFDPETKSWKSQKLSGDKNFKNIYNNKNSNKSTN
jgi:hypothetical protein